MGKLLDQRHRPDGATKGHAMNATTVAVQHPTNAKRLMRIDRAVYNENPDDYALWDGDEPIAPHAPDEYAIRTKELKALGADDVRTLCNQMGITYGNKPDAIDDILAAEFDDTDED